MILFFCFVLRSDRKVLYKNRLDKSPAIDKVSMNMVIDSIIHQEQQQISERTSPGQISMADQYIVYIVSQR